MSNTPIDSLLRIAGGDVPAEMMLAALAQAWQEGFEHGGDSRENPYTPVRYP